MAGPKARVTEREKQNELLKGLQDLKERDFTEENPQENIQLEILNSLRRIESYLAIIADLNERELE